MEAQTWCALLESTDGILLGVIRTIQDATIDRIGYIHTLARWTGVKNHLCVYILITLKVFIHLLVLISISHSRSLSYRIQQAIEPHWIHTYTSPLAGVKNHLCVYILITLKVFIQLLVLISISHSHSLSYRIQQTIELNRMGYKHALARWPGVKNHLCVYILITLKVFIHVLVLISISHSRSLSYRTQHSSNRIGYIHVLARWPGVKDHHYV